MQWPPPLATRGRSAAPAGTVSAAPALIEFSDGASWKRVPAGLRAGLSALYGVVASSGRDAARDIGVPGPHFLGGQQGSSAGRARRAAGAPDLATCLSECWQDPQRWSRFR